MLLFKQSFRINKKLIGISLAGLAAIIFIALFLSQSTTRFQIWFPGRSLAIFSFFFFSLGIVYTSLSFPAFRSKEKTMSYLMLPASTAEKFIFEFLTRIIAYFLIMPVIFWIVANIEGTIIHHYMPVSENFYYKFPFATYFKIFSHTTASEGWNNFGGLQIGLFAFLAVFAGASHFSKSPLIKTIFTFSISLIGFSLLSYLLYKGLNLNEDILSNEGVFFVKTKNTAAVVVSLLFAAVNIVLLAIAWFSLKEKEA